MSCGRRYCIRCDSTFMLHRLGTQDTSSAKRWAAFTEGVLRGACGIAVPAQLLPQRRWFYRAGGLLSCAAIAMSDCILLTALWRSVLGGRAAVLSAREGVRLLCRHHFYVRCRMSHAQGEVSSSTPQTRAAPHSSTVHAVAVPLWLRAVSPGFSSHAAGECVAALVSAGFEALWPHSNPKLTSSSERGIQWLTSYRLEARPRARMHGLVAEVQISRHRVNASVQLGTLHHVDVHEQGCAACAESMQQQTRWRKSVRAVIAVNSMRPSQGKAPSVASVDDEQGEPEKPWPGDNRTPTITDEYLHLIVASS